MERSLHFIRVGKSQSLKLELRVLPVKNQSTWFTCEHQQEVINLLQGVIETKLEVLRVRGKTLDKVTAQQEPDLITGATVRVAYCFKKNEVNHTFLVDNRVLDNRHSSCDPTTEEEDTPNTGGSYRSFKVEQYRLVACVCQYNSTSPQTLSVNKLLQGLSQVPKAAQAETTDISNYFQKVPEQTTCTGSDGQEVTSPAHKSRKNLCEMMQRGKLLKKSKMKNHQMKENSAFASHACETQYGMDQKAAGATKHHMETQVVMCDEAEKDLDGKFVEEETVSNCSENIPSDCIDTNVNIPEEEERSVEATDTVVDDCQHSLKVCQQEGLLPKNVERKKRGRPKKNKVPATSQSTDVDVKMCEVRKDNGSSIELNRALWRTVIRMRTEDSSTEDSYKNEGAHAVIDLDNIGFTHEVYPEPSMLQNQNTGNPEDVLGGDLFESNVQNSDDDMKELKTTGGKTKEKLLPNSSQDISRNLINDNRPYESSRSTGISANDMIMSEPSDDFKSTEDSSELESGPSNRFRMNSNKTRTKRKLDSPLKPQPSKSSKLSLRRGRKAVRKNCFDDYVSSEDIQDGHSSQESVGKEKDQKEVESVKQYCATVTSTPSSTDTEDNDTVNVVKLLSFEKNQKHSSSHSCHSKTQDAPKKSFKGSNFDRVSNEKSSAFSHSQERLTSRRVGETQEVKIMQENYDDELVLDGNKRIYSEEDTYPSEVSADDDSVISKRKKRSTLKLRVSSKTCPRSLEEQTSSPIEKTCLTEGDTSSQAELFRKVLSPVPEQVEKSPCLQGSTSSKNEIIETSSQKCQDSRPSKQQSASQVMRKRLGTRRQRSKVFDQESAESTHEDQTSDGSLHKMSRPRLTVFDQDLDTSSNASDVDDINSVSKRTKRGSKPNITSEQHSKKTEMQSASVYNFEEDTNENVVEDNTGVAKTSKQKRKTRTRVAGGGKKSTVVDLASEDNKARKRGSKEVSKTSQSQDPGRGNRRQLTCKTEVSKKCKVAEVFVDEQDVDTDVVIQENFADNGKNVEEAMDTGEDEIDEMYYDMDDPGAVDDWQTTEIEDSIKTISHVKDLNSEQIRYLVQKHDRYLKDIFKGKVFCRRHEDYKKGGISRADLDFQVRLGMFHEAHQDEVMDVLNAMFCPAGNNKYLDYVFKVLLPEALIKIHMEITGNSHDQSEDIMQQALSRRSLCASMSMSD